MKSMTGFGRSVSTADDGITISVSSVNRKVLEVTTIMPRDWQSFEFDISREVKKFFSRGKVTVLCKIENGNKGGFLSNEEHLKEKISRLEKICENIGAEFKPTAELILKLSDTETSEALSEKEIERVGTALLTVANEALLKNDEMRIAEGKALGQDFEKRLLLLSEMVSKIESESKNTVQKYRDALLQRLKDAKLDITLDDDRLLKEIALFADRCDICEEITRLKSHIAQFSENIKLNEPIGRKLDFLCQEIGREINTISSKANNLALTKTTLDFKNELERIREQVQNIE